MADIQLKIYLVGRLPPPVGGVTIHTRRLSQWLLCTSGVSVANVVPKVRGLLSYFFSIAYNRKEQVITHCQTSSAFGLIFITFTKLVLFSRNKVIFSVHSEYWTNHNFGKNLLLSRVMLFCVKRAHLIICDNNNIAEQFLTYTNKTKVITPFLPPKNKISEGKLDEYLGVPTFDSPVIVFNAYKLAYKDDGSDIYGLNVLLESFSTIDIPIALILLIPQIRESEKSKIFDSINSYTNTLNKERIHLISNPDLDGWQVIAKSDLFVRPTITDGDALSVREALYFGTPVIASDCTARPKGTILFQTGNPIDLATKIVTVATDNSMTKPRKLDSQNNAADDYLEAYKSLFNEKK